ncbi:uncharacterized protein EAF01_004398 [Botrytis porri]|uniref:Uncharacterized protein n=1 Tax=Botrytis porri TaxID=87229 RepID=A0A4Z1KL20_9HELO|nr:uncharacterized protein EAF01_004398 [Botrytis porri]KAF7908643.1 hypothetical protein EAF01_004398 [Botrytis porri]TGO86757.1 hypothetical protein BPOR_0279g00120 [Botrytis porri]
MPPPVTPSPHRFVIQRQSGPSAPPPRSQPAQESTPRPSNTQQFNTTPRFTFSSTPKPNATQSIGIPSSTPAGRYLTPSRQSTKTKENIDDPSDDYPAHLPLHDSIDTNDDIDTALGYSTENEDENADDTKDYEINPRSSKRRRISVSPDITLEEEEEDPLSSPLPIIPSPISHRPTQISSTASKPKFLLSTPVPSTPQCIGPTTFLKPPRFRPPDPAESQGSGDPLPEQFSPHRKGRQYVAGGLAAEVRDWLINIDSGIGGLQKGKERSGEWVTKIKIEEVRRDGREMCLVRGKQVRDVDGEEVIDGLGEIRAMLAGEGMGMGLQRGMDVDVGRIVGIKGPVWEIVVEGVKWGVGVEWKVLG